MDAITAAEMRALEQEAIASGRVTGLELMERAGQGVVEAIFEEWPDMQSAAPKYATVICGTGNNGGDGFVVARLLRERGWYVDLLVVGDKSRIKGDAAAAMRTLGTAPNFVAPIDAWRSGGAIYETETQLVIDAMFGTGLNRAMPEELQALLCDDFRLYVDNDLGTKCIAIDLPSGLHPDTGELMGDAFKAHLTVTFHRPKRGHLTAGGPDHCGKLVVKDIGL